MTAHATGICDPHAADACTWHMHGRTDGLTENLLSCFEEKLTFCNAGEKP